MPWYIGTKSQEGRVKKKWRRVSSSTFYLKGGRNFWKIIEPIYVQNNCFNLIACVPTMEFKNCMSFI